MRTFGVQPVDNPKQLSWDRKRQHTCPVDRCTHLIAAVALASNPVDGTSAFAVECLLRYLH